MEFSTVSHKTVEKQGAVAVLSSLEQLTEEMKTCDRIFLPLSTPVETLLQKQDEGYPVGVEVPRGMFGREAAIEKKLQLCKEAGLVHVRVNNLGALALTRRLGMISHGGFGLNLFNTPALEWAKTFGLADVELSFELTLEQMKKLGGTLPRGIFSYGRLPLMLTRNCPIKNGVGSCANCDRKGEITDRKGISFPVRCNGGCSEVFNSVPLDWLDRQNELSDLDFQILHFTVENRVESVESFTRLKSKDKPPREHTRGLYVRGVE
jgi:putative protease